MSEPASKPAAGTLTANIHLRWEDVDRTIPVPLPRGDCTLLDLLPAARAISHEATAVALEQARSQGREISCRAGCGACCRQLVAISVVESQSLADLVAAMPPERQSVIRRRFTDAIGRLEESELLDPHEAKGERSIVAADQGARDATLQGVGRRYFELQIACPFLENESCSIHPDRPIVCREHHVTTPAENCAKLYQVNVDRVEPAARLGEALARTADHVHGTGAFMIPLVLSLEWSEAHGPLLKKPQDGKVLFQTMMGELT
ncbi:MAG: YkgJ family cysteine cluster protein [Planctomycetes bacterium]|nr:YkgJ family cysteine cluster protein [Planctomycetota bacterium]